MNCAYDRASDSGEANRIVLLAGWFPGFAGFVDVFFQMLDDLLVVLGDLFGCAGDAFGGREGFGQLD